MSTITYVPPKNDGPPISLYSAAQLAAELLPNASEWTRSYVETALEELTICSIHQGFPPKFDRAMVVREVREMNLCMESRDDIAAELERTTFDCQWVYPTFTHDARGFQLL